MESFEAVRPDESSKFPGVHPEIETQKIRDSSP
jgi:hypothetical protein